MTEVLRFGGEGRGEEGLTIEQAWLAEQLGLRRPSTCVLVDRFASQPVSRITRLRVATAQALVDELIERLARNFRFPDRHPMVAAFEDAYFDDAPPVAVGVLAGAGGHVVSLVSADPRLRQLTYHDPWPEGTLLPGTPASTGTWTIEADVLAAIVVYALEPDVPPVERSPDIYAPTVGREADPAKGAPLDVIWHSNWQLGGPNYCLHVAGTEPGDVERIPYRAELPVEEIVEILTAVFHAQEPFACSVSVRVGANRGHSITLLGIDGDRVTFHDPWPEGSLLRADQNELGIEARPDDRRWSITTTELRRCLHAAFVSPEALADLQGRVFHRRLPGVLAGDLAFFNIQEIRRTQRGNVWEVEAKTGGFQDKVDLAFAVDDHERLEATLLSL